MTRLALLDGDIIAYRASVAAQADIDWGDGQEGLTVSPQDAAEAAVQTVRLWTRLARAKDCIVAFTGRENWRKRVLPTYKQNRAGKVKPQAYVHTVNAVRDRFECQLVEGLEADDVLGIMATNPQRKGAVIVTLDKDLRTIPGMHLNPLKEDKPVRVEEAEADHRWLMQSLMGDTSDGYTGIPGVGPKKAGAILGAIGQPLEALWQRVVSAYRKAKLTEEDALVQARVARILRRGDYDRKSKEVVLWHPTTPVRIPAVARV